MKIHFNPKDMLPKLRLAKAATVKSPKPILQNVKIVADKESGATLHATDTELGIRIRFKCKVLEDGAAVLPTKRLIDILASTKASQITLASNDGGIALEGDGEESTFLTQSPDEFPDVSDFTAESYHEILVCAMQAAIQQTVFATDKEDVRLAMAGVCFESDQRTITAVASDGRQLAWQSAMGATVGEPKIDTAIVPVKTLTLLDKALKDKSIKGLGKVKMAANVSVDAKRQTSGTVFFQCGDFTLFSRLQEGRYPKWRGIVPKTEDKTCATVHCGDLRTAVKSVKGVLTSSESGIYLMFDKGQLTLIGQGKEVGKTKKTIPLTYTGRKMTFKVDESFLTAYLKALDAKTKLSVYLPEDAGDPILIRCTGDYGYVVMPMSYKDEDLPTECRDIAASACEKVECEPDDVESENEADAVPMVESEPEIEAEPDDEESEPEVKPAAIEMQWSEKVPTEPGQYFVYYETGTDCKQTALARLFNLGSGRLSIDVAGQDEESLTGFLWHKQNVRWLAIDESFLSGLLEVLPKPMALDKPETPESEPETEVASTDCEEVVSEAVVECVEVKASKPPTTPIAPQPRPANGGKSAVVQRESGASVNGTILSTKQRGYIVFEEQESGKQYRIPTHGCKKRSREGVTYVSISEVHLLANSHLLGMFTSQSLF